jgi:hypothetical protein
MNDRRIATAVNMAVRQRNYRRARDRALARLANAYPDDYKELLEQEKANDETQGRKWLDIDGTTADVGLRPAPTVEHSNQTRDQSSYKSNNGGEA